MLAGLSTGHMVGLAVVAAIFIAFALASSFLAPRHWPDFPGEHGLSVFMIACIVMFAAMLTAVAVFDVEEPEKETPKQQQKTSSLPNQQSRLARVSLPTLGA